MCIRDSAGTARPRRGHLPARRAVGRGIRAREPDRGAPAAACLLYTSDAADERSSVDLGGRRIIKKKKTKKADNRRK